MFISKDKIVELKEDQKKEIFIHRCIYKLQTQECLLPMHTRLSIWYKYIDNNDLTINTFGFKWLTDSNKYELGHGDNEPT